MKKLCFMLLLLLLTFCVSCFAGTASLSWDASASMTVTGYKVYYGVTSHVYSTPIIIGNVTSYALTTIPDGIYFIAVTAFDAQGNESDFSNEIMTTIITIAAPTNVKRTTVNGPSK